MSNRPLFILYGSATGNAEHIAKDLSAKYEILIKNPDADTFFDSVVCCPLDDWKKKCATQWESDPPQGSKKHGMLLVASTTGNGDAPENASRFVRFIKRKTTAPDTFSKCAFSVLGLGDTNYDIFCATGKLLDRKIGELGGTRVLDLVCADEGTGNLEEYVEKWLSLCLPAITDGCRNSHGEDSKIDDIMDESKEEKSEEHGGQVEFDGDSPATSGIAPSVQLLRALLQRKDDEPLWEVNLSKLPGMTSSLSSCELIKDPEAEMAQLGRNRADSLSTASSGFYYNMNRPFESTILKARYLTTTSTSGAIEAAKDTDLNKRQAILEQHFPLDDPRNEKRVIEVTLSLPEDKTLVYQPGDSLGLVVSNTPSAVEFVLEMLLEHHGVLRTHFVSIDESHPITVEEAIRDRIDLCSPIRNKRTLNSLSQFASDPVEASALQLLSSKTAEGEKLFSEYVDQQRLSVFDILREFPSTRCIPMEGLLSILSGIPPRYYSVSSSPLDLDRPSLTIAFSVVDYLTPSLLVNGKDFGKRRVHGVATSFLESVSAGVLAPTPSTGSHKLRIFPKPTSDFRMPENLATPLILVGPGTGIAPFMGFLAHRRALVTQRDSADGAVVEGTWRGGYDMDDDTADGGSTANGYHLVDDFHSQNGVGSVDLFFGCRHADHDWLYREEMEALVKTGVIARLHTAFSRDTPKMYVQDVMRQKECGDRLVKLLLDESACVYICGDGNKMAKDVQSALVELLSASGRLAGGVDEAQAVLAKLKKQHRLLLDIWS